MEMKTIHFVFLNLFNHIESYGRFFVFSSFATAEDFSAVTEQAVVGNRFTSKSRYLPPTVHAKSAMESCSAIDYELFGSTQK